MAECLTPVACREQPVQHPLHTALEGVIGCDLVPSQPALQPVAVLLALAQRDVVALEPKAPNKGRDSPDLGRKADAGVICRARQDRASVFDT